MQSSLGISRPAIVSRPVFRRHPVVRTRAAIIPELQILLDTYVCPVINDCSGIFIGTDQHQQSVLEKLHAIANHYDIVQSEKYVIRALLLDDDKLAMSIADSTDIYHKSIELVREQISKLPSIHTLPREI
jgi:hypothetical protein